MDTEQKARANTNFRKSIFHQLDLNRFHVKPSPATMKLFAHMAQHPKFKHLNNLQADSEEKLIEMVHDEISKDWTLKYGKGIENENVILVSTDSKHDPKLDFCCFYHQQIGYAMGVRKSAFKRELMILIGMMDKTLSNPFEFYDIEQIGEQLAMDEDNPIEMCKSIMKGVRKFEQFLYECRTLAYQYQGFKFKSKEMQSYAQAILDIGGNINRFCYPERLFQDSESGSPETVNFLLTEGEGGQLTFLDSEVMNLLHDSHMNTDILGICDWMIWRYDEDGNILHFSESLTKKQSMAIKVLMKSEFDRLIKLEEKQWKRR